MAQLIPKTLYELELNDRELAVVLKALAAMAGVDVNAPNDEERELATDLNRRMLENHRANLIERLRQADNKIAKAAETAQAALADRPPRFHLAKSLGLDKKV